MCFKNYKKGDNCFRFKASNEIIFRRIASNEVECHKKKFQV